MLISFTTSTFGRALLLAAVMACVPFAASADSSDPQDGSRGNISQPVGKTEAGVHTTGDGATPATMARPESEGVDLQGGARGTIHETETTKKQEASHPNGKPIHQQNPDMEGVDLQRGAKNTIK